MDPGIISILAVISGAIVTLLAPLISNWQSSRDEEKKWTREKNAEKDRRSNELLREIYGNCLASLASKPIDRSKAAKWLQLLLIYYPSRNSDKCIDEYNSINTLVSMVVQGKENDVILDILHQLIVEMAAVDPRLKVNGEPRERSALYWGTKGRMQSYFGNYEKAIELFDKALGLSQNYPVAYIEKGIALSALAKYEEAIKCFDKAIGLQPHSEEAWTRKGIALNGLSKHEDAVKSFDEAIRLNKRYLKAWIGKGDTLMKLNRIDDAKEAYSRAEELKDHK